MPLKPKIRIFDLNNPLHRTALDLFDTVLDTPLVCPHSHVDPKIFINPANRFSDPATLFVTSDHYVLRMLVSQGISYDRLGISKKWEMKRSYSPLDVWQTFCDHFFLFDGTPSGLWIENALSMVFEIGNKPNSENAEFLYERIQSLIQREEFSPRNLFERFNIEVLCTTDAVDSQLEAHKTLTQTGWQEKIRPTFRPDGVIKIYNPGWRHRIDELSQITGININNYAAYIQAMEDRRTYFKSHGAVATDHGAETAFTCRLTDREAKALFTKGLQQKIGLDEANRFVGHMMFEMARMSVEDGLVMQFHVGAFRNHNPDVFNDYGSNMGFDIPLKVEWTKNLKPLLDVFGMDERLRLILFTLDESGYSRELAPLAGAYPAIKIGPPWWFHDSPNGMMRYFESVMEIAGIDNTVGFNDDTRAFLSIPTRHDLWRRMASLWLAKLVHRGQIDFPSAKHRIYDLAYSLAKNAYRLD